MKHLSTDGGENNADLRTTAGQRSPLAGEKVMDGAGDGSEQEMRSEAEYESRAVGFLQDSSWFTVYRCTFVNISEKPKHVFYTREREKGHSGRQSPRPYLSKSNIKLNATTQTTGNQKLLTPPVP